MMATWILGLVLSKSTSHKKQNGLSTQFWGDCLGCGRKMNLKITSHATNVKQKAYDGFYDAL